LSGCGARDNLSRYDDYHVHGRPGREHVDVEFFHDRGVINSPGLALTISDSASNLMPDPLGTPDWPSCPDPTPCSYKPTVTYN